MRSTIAAELPSEPVRDGALNIVGCLQRVGAGTDDHLPVGPRWRQAERVALALSTHGATINEMTEDNVKVTLTEPGVAGSYVVAERRPDGALLLKPEREKLSAVITETEDDLGDYEPE